MDIPVDVKDVAKLCIARLPSWADLDISDVTVSPSDASEWHQLFFVESRHGKVVATYVFARGAALMCRSAASMAAAERGIAPKVYSIAEVKSDNGAAGATLQIIEFMNGGILRREDFLQEASMSQIGILIAQFHQIPPSWFDPVRPSMEADALLGGWDCLWILRSLRRQVSERGRKLLAEEGVDWAFIESEINNMPQNPILPKSGATTTHVTVHGDCHLQNIMRHNDCLRFIDFDMTAVGPAGCDLCNMVLFPTQTKSVLPLPAQCSFATSYLTTMCPEVVPTETDVDAFLFDIQRWAYFGMIKIGLVCAVLMLNPRFPEKRALMRSLAPILLSPVFLGEAMRIARVANEEGQEDLRAEVVREGLFDVTEKAWKAITSA